MTDPGGDILARLVAHRLPNLDALGGIQFPYYGGLSVANLPASICRWLGAPEIAGEGLEDALLGCGDGVERVVLIVLDGLGYDAFQSYLERGVAPLWNTLVDQAVYVPITSIVPSTTAAVITTLWSGRTAIEHGVVGYEVFLREYGVTANMLQHSVQSFGNDTGGLARAGFEAEQFIPYPMLSPHLKRFGVPTYAFMHNSIARSGLSRSSMAETPTYGFITAGDLWLSLVNTLEAVRQPKAYFYVYWSELDTLMHRYGPGDARVEIEFASFSQGFAQFALPALQKKGEGKTLVILTADHGMIATPKNADLELRSHPELGEYLHMLPTGETRLPILFTRPGNEKKLRRFLYQTWGDAFTAIPTDTAIRGGLFGTAKPSRQALERLGDTILVANGANYLWWPSKENHQLARHGGLSRQEMLVPFFAFRV